MIIQASCAVYMSHNPRGFLYAVQRHCHADALTCAEACSDPKLRDQDSQTAGYSTWRCVGGTHVYFNFPATGDGTIPALGLKQYYFGYNACGGGCGPNYKLLLCTTLTSVGLYTD